MRGVCDASFLGVKNVLKAGRGLLWEDILCAENGKIGCHRVQGGGNRFLLCRGRDEFGSWWVRIIRVQGLDS